MSLNLENAVGSRKSTQAIGAPSKTEKLLITNKVTTNFFVSLCTPISYVSFSHPATLSRLNNHPHSTVSQTGFSLIEVLVTVVVTAFGLIGLAGLQMSSVNTTTKASANTHTQIAMQEIVGQLLANKDAAKAGSFNILANADGTLQSFTVNPDISNLNFSEKITYRWFNNLNNVIPGVKAGIECNAKNMCAIRIQLSESIENMEQVVSIQL